jgi:ATP-binding cassette subfamily G (WHITE) protein 2 (SNQ2)
LVLVAIGWESISCSYTELVSANPPKGLTYSKYMDPSMAFGGGYLTNPESAEGCQCCPAKTVYQLIYSRFNIKYSNHWRNLGIVFGFLALRLT